MANPTNTAVRQSRRPVNRPPESRMRRHAIMPMTAPIALMQGMQESTMATTANAELVPGGVEER